MPELSAQSFSVSLRFSAGVRALLYPRDRTQPTIRVLKERTTVKDVIESCGVPHTEVDQVLREAVHVGLDTPVGAACSLAVHGVHEGPAVGSAARLQPVHCKRFVADGHLGKLVRLLRLLGLDVAYASTVEDRELLRIMTEEGRGLLTRDRRLLMHRIVEVGYCPRSDEPESQAREILRRFELEAADLAPWTRCLRCNGRLVAVPKAAIENRLEPLTKRHFETFHRCEGCGQVYWTGSHTDRLAGTIARLIGPSDTQEE
ncbi:MAG: Mut7-C RNAse domain-containing protein [Opitutales bacterium]